MTAFRTCRQCEALAGLPGAKGSVELKWLSAVTDEGKGDAVRALECGMSRALGSLRLSIGIDDTGAYYFRDEEHSIPGIGGGPPGQAVLTPARKERLGVDALIMEALTSHGLRVAGN
jgi:hypothetical protein